MVKFIMKRFIKTSLFLISLLLFLPKNVFASNYEITSFDAQITLNQDSSLTIKETIDANFLQAKHGIYRVIPYIYTNKGKTIKSRFKVLSVTNDSGLPVDYTIENFKQSKRLKIGDANLTVTGPQIYTIEYKVNDVVLDYGQGPEIYWNVTGTEWDAPIQKASAKVTSSFGSITKTKCFGCDSSFTPNQADFDGQMGLTIVVQIDPVNNLIMPSKVQKIINLILDNFGYILAIIPVSTMAYLWFTKGRDKKYLSENVFYEPDSKATKSVPLFSRPHLPLVYSPINGLTPAEIGTIIDEKVDTKDIVAEIVELARLKFLTIKKVENKGFLGVKSTDYQLIKSQKTTEKLNKFQTTLLSKIFDTQDDIKISTLKNHFYKHLPDLKEKLYDQLQTKKLTEGNIENVRDKWVILGVLLNFLTIFIIIWFATSRTNNFSPVIIVFIGLIPSLIFANNMPRKTAYGYSLHRQAVGLKYYLSHGKWREEIMEKNLFLEEMLPLAITLGVVSKLAKDMKVLGIEPPSYMQGMVMSSFVNDLNSFNTSMASNLTSSPGSSSYSGSSGFSGGGGGGGFGGGGGGSW